MVSLQVPMQPLVSILIPAYNAQEWISHTIQSALAQTWPRKEIIIVDDGSKDGTLAIARHFASDQVVVFSQANQGAAAARNKAFELSHGDYIQWLDADDLLSPGKIADQMAVAAASTGKRTLFSSGWAYFMHRPSRARFLPTPLWCDLTPVEWMHRKWGSNHHMQTATWLVSRELTVAAGPWDTRLLGDDDGEYFARVIKASDGIRFVAESKVYYRIAGTGSLSYIGRSDKKMNAQFLGMKLQIGYLRSLDDGPQTRAACVNYLQTWLPNFYPHRPDIVKEAQDLAKALGGELHPPKLSWKYAWIQKLFGWNAANISQLRYNRCKTAALLAWDKAMLSLEGRSGAK